MIQEVEDLVAGLRPGVYQHYKGGLYYVLGVASCSTNIIGIGMGGPEISVIYISLTADGRNNDDTPMHYREIYEFCGLVEIDPIAPQLNPEVFPKIKVQRFEYLGPTPATRGHDSLGGGQ